MFEKSKRDLLPGSMTSKTIYAFDFDNRILEIQDHDLFIPNQEATLNNFRIKVVNENIIEIRRADIRPVTPPYISLDNVKQKAKKPIHEIAKVCHRDNAFVLELLDELITTPNYAMLLTLEYKVELKGDGPKLQYIGSIQPSDYSMLKKHLSLGNVSKIVEMRVNSQRPFEGWFYSASSPIAFPQGEISSPLNPNNEKGLKCYSKKVTFEINIEEWERSYNFGIFCI